MCSEHDWLFSFVVFADHSELHARGRGAAHHAAGTARTDPQALGGRRRDPLQARRSILGALRRRSAALIEAAVVKQYLTSAADGKTYDTKHYNLAAIIAVGYKVTPRRGKKS